MPLIPLRSGALLMVLLAPAAAAAALNVPVASRLVAFVQPAPVGSIAAAIVFQPGNSASEAEAGQIERQFGAGLMVGRAVIHPSRVPTSGLDGLAGKRIAFLTSGLRSQAEVANAARRLSVLTVTADLACVQAGQCMIAVSGPNSQITVNKGAVAAAHIRLGSAFLMLVKEIGA